MKFRRQKFPINYRENTNTTIKCFKKIHLNIPYLEENIDKSKIKP